MPTTAAETFEQSIQDAVNLLEHCDTLNKHPPPPEIEVLKRAGLIMAMTAWETYVEDRVRQAGTARLQNLNDRAIANFVQSKLDEDILRLHNPTSTKTLELFRNYAGVDLTPTWSWEDKDHDAVRAKLDEYIKLRGDVVHRSRTVDPGPPKADPVKKDDLRRAIGFLRRLVKATESALETATP